MAWDAVGSARAATAEGYLWVERSFPDFAVAHCVTVIAGRSPTQVLASLGVTEAFELAGLTAAETRAGEMWRDHDGRQLLVAVVAIDGSSLMVEPNGYVGIGAAGMLSAGTAVVAHYRNVNALHHLVWVKDGRLLLDWDPFRPSSRHGDRAISASPLLRASGFAFGEDADELLVEAAFAFTENVTGVRPTAEVLMNAVFECGVVTEPG
jgi:hypothetical protein